MDGSIVPYVPEAEIVPPGAILADFRPHPITTEGRRFVTVPPGATLRDAFDGMIPPGDPALAMVNGASYERPVWHTVTLADGDIVNVRATVHGGGDGGSNPIAVILSVAILVAAPYLAGAALTGTWVAATGFAGSLLTAAIGAAGILVVNTLFPPRLPNLSAGRGVGQAKSQYSISGGANRARPYGSMLLLLGTHRIFPDLVAREYTEYDDEGEQYINQTLDFGIGDLDVGALKYAETPLDDYDSVDTQQNVVTVTLVAGNVDTIAGGEPEYDVALTRTTAGKTTALAFDVLAQYFRITDDGDLLGRDVRFFLEWREAGSIDIWQRRDVVLATPGGADARNMVRRSFKYDTGSAKAWEARVILKTDHDETNEKITFQANLASIRAYQDSKADFTGRNPLAVRAKATGQLYGRMERISAIVSQKIDSWNGSRWVAGQETSNPGDILLKFLRGWRINSRRVAGVGLDEDKIDFEAIQGFAEHCTTNGLSCNLVIDDDRDHNAAITLICQCGWGAYDESSGKSGVVWENEGQPLSGVITPGNIIAGSLAVNWNHEGLADEIVGNFIDEASDYQENQIRRNVPGIDLPERPVDIELEGVTDGEAAAKEVNRAVAAQAYHARVIGWEMRMQEGLGFSRGDVIGAAHGVLGNGIGGRLYAISADRLTLTPVNRPGQDGYVWVWDLNGKVLARTYTVDADGALVLSSALPAAPRGVDDEPNAYYIACFAQSSEMQKLRITAVESAGNNLRFQARDEVSAYYGHRTSDLSWDPLSARGDSELIYVAGFFVDENEVGLRSFHWDVRPSLAGYEIRYGAPGQDWPAMGALHEGLLQDSPWERVGRPDAGNWRFGIVGVTTDGRRTAPAYFSKELGGIVLGAAGEDGNGIEYVFTRTGDANLAGSKRPSNGWGFDRPGTVDGQQWHDGAVDINENFPYLWRCTRAVPGQPEVGDAVTDDWTGPVVVGRVGADGPIGTHGADGDDGTGYEFIFARTSGRTPSNPSNSWGFDNPQSPWSDAAPSLTATTDTLWRCFRRVSGSPSVGAAISDNWSSPSVVGRFGDDGIDGADGSDGRKGADGVGREYIFARTSGSAPSRPSNGWGFDNPRSPWSDAAPSLTATLDTLWRCERTLVGSPSFNQAVSASWTASVIVGRRGADGVAAPRQWTRIYSNPSGSGIALPSGLTSIEVNPSVTNYDVITALVYTDNGFSFASMPTGGLSTSTSRAAAVIRASESGNAARFRVRLSSTPGMLRVGRDSRAVQLYQIYGVDF